MTGSLFVLSCKIPVARCKL